MAFKLLDKLPEKFHMIKESSSQSQHQSQPKEDQAPEKQHKEAGKARNRAAVKAKPVQVSIDGIQTGSGRPDQVDDQPADWGGVVGQSQAHVVNVNGGDRDNVVTYDDTSGL